MDQAVLNINPFSPQLHEAFISAADYVGNPWPTDHPDVLESIKYQLSLRAGTPRQLLPQVELPSGILEESRTTYGSDDTQTDQDYWQTGPL